MEWSLFESLARLYLGITASGNRICYRVIRRGVPEELRCLRNQRDWESMLHGITASAGKGRYEAVEIHDVSVAPFAQYVILTSPFPPSRQIIPVCPMQH